MANTLFLARLWHFLRATVLPVYFFTKTSSIVYQFVTKGIFPKLKKSTMYLPKRQGSLSVLDISTQRKVLQQQYVTALLYNNSRSHKLPSYLMHILTFYLQLSFDNFYYETPLMFFQAREPSTLVGWHALSSLFQTIDYYALSDSWTYTPVNLNTCLELPFVKVCMANQSVPQYRKKSIICSQKVSFFLKAEQGKLVLRSRTECTCPNLLSRIRKNHQRGLLLFTPNFVSLMSNPPEFQQSPSTENFGISAYLGHFKYEFLE